MTELMRFSPKELGRMTGLTPVMQRDWRRAGYLPARASGWAKFDLIDISQIALRKTIADAGLGPALATPLLAGQNAERLVDLIAWWAVEVSDSTYEFADDIPDSAKAWLRRFDDDDHFSFVDTLTNLRREDHARAVRFAPGTDDVEFGYEEHLGDDVASPVVITLHLDRIGEVLAARAERPFIRIAAVGGVAGASDDA